MTRPWRARMKLCISCLFFARASMNAWMPADATPSASGVLRASPAVSSAQATWKRGEAKTRAPAPRPNCLRNLRRVGSMGERVARMAGERQALVEGIVGHHHGYPDDEVSDLFCFRPSFPGDA